MNQRQSLRALLTIRIISVFTFLRIHENGSAFAASHLAFVTPSHSRIQAFRKSSDSTFFTSMRASSSDTSIGIIGGGIAGLSCANHLASSNQFSQITVFDTGRLRPGGRCSSRYPDDKPVDPKNSKSTILGSQLIDHAAQILTAASSSMNKDSPFAKQVQEWENDGILKRFPKGSVCEIRKSQSNDSSSNSLNIQPINDNSDNVMYYGANGMGSIPAAIAGSGGFEIQQDVWVSPSNGVKYLSPKGNNQSSTPSWRVKAKGQTLGDYNQIVIAHNGKCADRLMSKTPAKALHSLLRTNFSPTVPRDGGKRMTLNSIYSLTFALKVDKDEEKNILNLPSNIFSAFIQNEDSLRFISCNSRKYPASRNSPSQNVQVWTVLSSPKFAKKYKGPQENLPSETVEEVTFLMLQALERSLSLKEGILTSDEGETILDSKLQLWGAAVPLNTWKTTNTDNYENTGFLYDSEHGVGACGDWLLESSIEGAWESGRRLAEWMIKVETQKTNKNNQNEDMSVGLPPNGKFYASSAVSKAGIGSLKNPPKKANTVK